MAAWGYEFYLLVLKVSLTSSLCSLVGEILSALEDKIRIPRGHVISSIYAVYLDKIFVFIKSAITSVRRYRLLRNYEVSCDVI